MPPPKNTGSHRMRRSPSAASVGGKQTATAGDGAAAARRPELLLRPQDPPLPPRPDRADARLADRLRYREKVRLHALAGQVERRDTPSLYGSRSSMMGAAARRPDRQRRSIDDRQRRPDRPAIFLAMLRLGCTSFGGGSAGWLYRDIVLSAGGWVDNADLSADSSRSARPCPARTGSRRRCRSASTCAAALGAAAALVGLLSGPFVIILVVGAAYRGLGEHPLVQAVLDGMAAAAIGLTFDTGLRSAWHGAPGSRRWRSRRRRCCASACCAGRWCRSCWCWRRSASRSPWSGRGAMRDGLRRACSPRRSLVFVPISLLSFGGSNAVDRRYRAPDGRGAPLDERARVRRFLRAVPRRAGAGLDADRADRVEGRGVGRRAGRDGGVLRAGGGCSSTSLSRLWGRWRGRPWHDAIERGLAPVAAGLLLSAGIAVLRASPGGWPIWAAAFAATALLLRWPKLPPTALIAAGGALFGIVAAVIQ